MPNEGSFSILELTMNSNVDKIVHSKLTHNSSAWLETEYMF